MTGDHLPDNETIISVILAAGRCSRMKGYNWHLRKQIKRSALILLIFFILLLTAQAITYIHILIAQDQLEPADLIIVNQGSNGRSRVAYDLVNKSYASVLVISPANSSLLKRYERIYRSKKAIQYIIEDKARTTFENALYTSQIIKQHDFEKVILVTSWNHMPRSYLLLELMLFGTQTQIQRQNVPTGRLNRINWFYHTVGWKMIYNEIVEFWGSLIEYTRYCLNGEVNRNRTSNSGLLKVLKGVVLFEINPQVLNTPSQ